MFNAKKTGSFFATCITKTINGTKIAATYTKDTCKDIKAGYQEVRPPKK